MRKSIDVRSPVVSEILSHCRFALLVAFGGAAVVLLSSANGIAQTYSFEDLDPPGAIAGRALGINPSGQDVVGAAGNGSGFDGAYLWSNGVYSTFQGTGTKWTQAAGVNDAGQIVGTLTYNDHQSGYLTTTAAFGTKSPISVPGATSTNPFSINNHGEIVGEYSTNSINGFLFDGTSYVTVDYPGASWTTAFGINYSGEIVGAWLDNGNVRHDWMRNSAEQFTAIDPPWAVQAEGGVGVNDSGFIVGSAVNAQGNESGWVRDPSGNYLTVLNFPGAISTEAEAISNNGVIVGRYTDSNNTEHSFIATPTPEPSTIALLGVGAIGLVDYKWRGRKQAA